MKKSILLLLGSIFLSGCMITGPIVDDLDHYKKGDTYESIRNEEGTNENEKIDNNIEGTTDDNPDSTAMERCINSRNNDPMIYEDESVIERHNQFETTEDFCAEFIKVNTIFYNDVIGITETGEPVGEDGEILEDY